MKKNSWLIFLLFFGLTSCGKKGSLEKPVNYKRPKFDHILDEDPFEVNFSGKEKNEKQTEEKDSKKLPRNK